MKCGKMTKERKDEGKVEQRETGKGEREENKNESKGKMKFKLTFH